MIVWQGLGFLAVLIPVIVLLLADALLGKGFMQEYGNEMAALVSAALVWFIGKKLNDAPGRELVDPKTNEKILLKQRHTIFWVPMQWFAVLLVIASISYFSKHFS